MLSLALFTILRSLNGLRDSEVCLSIEDTEFDDNCRMNGQTFSSGKFAGALRRRLMREHLGIYQAEWDKRVGKKLGYNSGE